LLCAQTSSTDIFVTAYSFSAPNGIQALQHFASAVQFFLLHQEYHQSQNLGKMQALTLGGTLVLVREAIF
jgi:hypothetical protein